MSMFFEASTFDQDLSGWDVANDQSFASARRIRLVCFDAYYNLPLFIVYNWIIFRETYLRILE